MKRKIICMLLALTLALSFAAGAQALSMDSAGTSLSGEAVMNAPVVDNDLYWMGERLNLDDGKIGNDAILAGNTMILDQLELGGDLRAAGYSLDLKGVKTEKNMTCAGYSVSYDPDCTARSVFTFAASVVFNGSAQCATLVGSTVTLNGHVKGDASIIADHVEIGSNAVVDGKLKVQASSEPSIPASASIANYEFSLSNVNIEETSQAAIAAAAAARTTHQLLSRVYWTFAMLLVALFFCLVMNGALTDAAMMVKMRTAPMLVSGVVGLLAMPLLLLVVCLSFIGLPLAGLLAGFYLLLILFAIPFTGASLGRAVFPNMNVWLSSMIGAAVLTALRIVPILKIFILWGSVMFATGYLIQLIYRNILSMRKKPMPEIPEDISVAPVETEQLETQNEEEK